ncbi:MAG: multidrug effflux MFS transporter [Verrucomicrobiales bacterium]|jgi:DHA1 family bicyclomycin/chloramphenicol resistance-like MFS transporter|nr:multidrug effflux MFS transporter [Verrucomicrobiales bacterium]
MPVRRDWKLVWILGALSAFAPLATDMYLPAFGDIARDLDTSIGSVQLTLAVFLLGLAAGQLLWGTLSDHVGRRLPLLAGCALFSVMTVAGALTRSVETLTVARFFMGLGGSAGMVVARAIVRDKFEAADAARFYSLMMIISGIAPIVAPFMGSLLLTGAGWRTIFWVLTVFGGLCCLAVALLVEETLPRDRRARGHVWAVFRGYGRILADRRFLGPALALGCAAGVLFTYIADSPHIFIELYGVPAAWFGGLFAANSVGLYLGNQLNSWLLRRCAAEWLLRQGLWCNLGLTLILALVTWTGWGGFPAFFAALFVTLASLGVIFPNATALAMQPFAAAAGSASAMLGISQFILGAAGGALVGLWHGDTPLPLALQIAVYAALGRAACFSTPTAARSITAKSG